MDDHPATSPVAAAPGRQLPLGGAAKPRTQPNPSESKPHHPFTSPFIPSLIAMTTSLRWIWAKERRRLSYRVTIMVDNLLWDHFAYLADNDGVTRQNVARRAFRDAMDRECEVLDSIPWDPTHTPKGRKFRGNRSGTDPDQAGDKSTANSRPAKLSHQHRPRPHRANLPSRPGTAGAGR